jgi:PAS domain S-box-containing protein
MAGEGQNMAAMNVPALLATYQLRQREYLLRISRAMTSRLELPSLLKLILSSAAEMVGCRAGLLALAPDPSQVNDKQAVLTRFQVRAVYNIAPQNLPAFAPLLDVFPLMGNEDEDEGEGDAPDVRELQARVRQVESKMGIHLGQVVGLPLLLEDEVLGIIYLFRSEYAFTQMDWQFLQGFADQAAIAVRNARLYLQLETERSRLATIVENSADGILILDENRRVVVINQALAAMVDIAPESAVGRPCQEVLALENVQGDDFCQGDVDIQLLGESGLRCEGDLARPGGGRVTVSTIYTPLYDEEGRLMNVIVNVHDITRFREEEEIKSTFTSIISHELKTPVALIKGYAQTLARPDADWDAETARNGLHVIEEEADRLEALINNLLDVSRIQAGGLRLDLEQVDIHALAARVVHAYGTQTEHHHLELDFPPGLPEIWGDRERLRQVLTNLIGNAIKYSPEGGTIRIGGWFEPLETADAAQEASNVHVLRGQLLRNEAAEGEQSRDASPKGRLVFYVADQGIGIPPEEVAHIFDRFYRVDSSLRRNTAGAGLGLFLCRAIAEAHGGQIWAHSEPGKGTTFFVGIPVGLAAAE